MCKLLVLLAALFFSVSLFGTDFSSLPELLNNDLLRKQQEQIDYQRRQVLQKRELKKETIEQQKRSHHRLKSKDKKLCFMIKKINVNGASLMAKHVQQKISFAYINSCMTMDDINELLRQLNDWYFTQGYITTRIYLPQQDLSKASLTIEVVEGYIEAIDFTDTEKNNHLSLFGAMPVAAGALLNVRDLEQGLEQLNRLSSNNIQLQFVPGDQPGATKILLDNEIEKKWRIDLSLNNYGQASTGEEQLALFFDRDSPLADNGYFYLSYQTSLKQFQDDDQSSENLALHYDVPYGYWNFYLDASWSDYLTTTKGITQYLEFKGKSDQQRLSLARMIHRDQQNKWRLNFSLLRKNNKNYVQDNFIKVNSRVLSIGEIQLNFWHYFKNYGLLSTAIAYQQGLKLFDALHDKHSSVDFPKAQFKKIIFSGNYQNAFNIQQHDWYWLSSLRAQYSDDLLYGSERLSLGSQYSIRAYKNQGISGDKGAYWRNEFTTKLPSSWLSSLAGEVHFKTGFDIGSVLYQTVDKYKWQLLQGWFIGARWQSKHLNMGLMFSQPIAKPHWLKADGSALYLDVSLNY